MNDFPEFMKNPKNAIAVQSQSPGIEGYVYDGADGGQMAFWSCKTDGVSEEHVHDFDEYFVVLQGTYTHITGDERIEIKAGQEYFIPKGQVHSGEFVAGTRTIHAFGGPRTRRAIEQSKGA